MELISINIGQLRTIVSKKFSGDTGIYKLPAQGLVQVNNAGLAGDVVHDKKHHGGPDQAVYIYGQTDYDWWEAELGRPLDPGTFGENLTISGLASANFRVGDRLRIGEVVLEVTAPRIPCGTLAARMGEPAFAKHFRQAARPGLYCRVLQEGAVQAGQEVTVISFSGATVSIEEMFNDHYRPELDLATVRRYLAAPIAVRSRRDMEKELARLTGLGL